MLTLDQFLKPAQSSIIDSFCNIVAKVETRVVASTKHKDEFPWTMLNFGDFEFRILLLEGVGVDEGGFVAKVLAAFAEVLREIVFGLLLQDV